MDLAYFSGVGLPARRRDTIIVIAVVYFLIGACLLALIWSVYNKPDDNPSFILRQFLHDAGYRRAMFHSFRANWLYWGTLTVIGVGGLAVIAHLIHRAMKRDRGDST